MKRGESIATVIIISYTIAIVIVVLISILINYFAVDKLEKQMKYYSERNLESESFIPLSMLIGMDSNTSLEDDCGDIEEDSNNFEI